MIEISDLRCERRGVRLNSNGGRRKSWLPAGPLHHDIIGLTTLDRDGLRRDTTDCHRGGSALFAGVPHGRGLGSRFRRSSGGAGYPETGRMFGVPSPTGGD